MNDIYIRLIISTVVSLALSLHGKAKKSLNTSGVIAATFVGFSSFFCSYRFGILLILFYYTGSKFTKFKEKEKSKYEEDYVSGGQRNWIQVFANSILATLVAIIHLAVCGEDIKILSFSSINDPVSIFGLLTVDKNILRTHLICCYLAHYACATADTWASEIGILSKSKPRLITSLFLREVPHGTNGGMSSLGTLASALGGAFIGFCSALYDIVMSYNSIANPLKYTIFVTLLCLVYGVLGSCLDSLLGATVQATFYSHEKKCIAKHPRSKGAVIISGIDILSNEGVNLVSIIMVMILSLWLSPYMYSKFWD